MKLRNPVPRISLLILASVPLYWFLISGQARMVDGALTGDEMVFPEKIYVLLPSLSIFATLGVGLSRAYKATRWGWFWLQVFVFPMTYIYTLVVDRGDGSGPPTRKQSNAFLAHEPLPGVAFEHNAHVRVVSGEHAGEKPDRCA